MPLRRHPALVPLSREHHPVLIFARSLLRDAPPLARAALPSTHVEIALHVAERFAREIDPHFRIEEAVLVTAFAGRGADLDAMNARLFEEHAAIRSLAAKVAAGGGNAGAEAGAAEATEAWLAACDEFGRALEAHVRFEEREWFEAIQAAARPGELEAMAGRMVGSKSA